MILANLNKEDGGSILEETPFENASDFTVLLLSMIFDD
jgi:hypothetical protein